MKTWNNINVRHGQKCYVFENLAHRTEIYNWFLVLKLNAYGGKTERYSIFCVNDVGVTD